MTEQNNDTPKKRKKLKAKTSGRPRNVISNRKDRTGKALKGRISSTKYGDPSYKPIKTNNKPGVTRYVLPFEEAKAIIRDECLGSRNDFIRWWNINIPARIPKNPARTYSTEGWVSWGDWLGTYNEFPDPKKIYRSFHDARNYARSLKLKTREAWVELGREGKLPSDIPAWPNLVYGKTILTGKPKRGGFWISWKDWIGSSLSDQLTAIKDKLNVLVIARRNDTPSNVYTFFVMSEFEQDLKIKLMNPEIKPLKIYHISPSFDWGTFLTNKFHTYYNTPGLYMIANINEVYYYFGMYMSEVNLVARH